MALLRLAETEKVYWPWLSDAGGKPVDKKGANKFIFGCIIDYQMNANIVWNNAKRFTEEYLGDPEELWKEIFKRYPTLESWNAKKREFNLHRFPQAHEKIWKTGKIILEYYDGDVRKTWINKKTGDILECFKNKLKLGKQLSRMALGGLISSKQISCKGDVKADIHVRRVLGRIFYQNYEKEILSEEEATELTRKIYPENPWTLDGPLYLIGGNNCKAKEPDCDNCYTTSLCDYFMSEKKGTTSAFWYKKGWALYLQGEYEEAIKCYDKALKIEPKNFITLNNKGLTLYVQGEYEEAIKCYDKALKIEPASSFVLYNKGMALYGQGEYEEAIKCYNKALKIEPDSSLVLYNKGLALYGQGEYEEAIKCYDKALKIEPDNINILNSKGLALYELGEYEKAIKYYDKALKIESDSSLVLYNKGMVLYELGEYDEAIKCYDEALKIEPDFVLALHSKGLTLYELGEYGKAIKYYDKALKIEPDFVEALFCKGNCLSCIKKYKEAISCYDRVIELDNEGVDALFCKGKSLYELKKYEEAIKCYEKLLEIDPNFEGIKEAIKECKQGSKKKKQHKGYFGGNREKAM